MDTFLKRELILVKSDDSHSPLQVGQPFFFLESETEVAIFEEPTIFLSEKYVFTRRALPSTWEKVAYSLKSWFQFLQASEIHWRYADASIRLDFRDSYLSSISANTGQVFGAKGVSDTMAVVRKFYQFAQNRGWYEGDLGAEGEDTDLPKVRPSSVIHPISVSNLKKLINHLGPQASNRNGDLRPCRDRLIADLGWVVGLRISEVLSLTTFQFLSLSFDPSTPYVDLRLQVLGKGGKTRQCAIPTWLVIDVVEYINTERAASLKSANGKKHTRNAQLFLAHISSSRRGNPISVDAVQSIIRAACFALGLISTVQKQNTETFEVFEAKSADHSFHDLRHTYAVLTYHAEVKNGNPEPWKKIQAQLGHSSLQTTIDIYLRHVHLFHQSPGLLNIRKMIDLY